jgi:hypothetical protein
MNTLTAKRFFFLLYIELFMELSAFEVFVFNHGAVSI